MVCDLKYLIKIRVKYVNSLFITKLRNNYRIKEIEQYHPPPAVKLINKGKNKSNRRLYT